MLGMVYEHFPAEQGLNALLNFFRSLKQ